MPDIVFLVFVGMSAHVITFEVGAVLEDAKWKAPYCCFEKKEEERSPKPESFMVPHATAEALGHKRVLTGLEGL